jgi:energy-coupling factor transport system ATP-binding protein
MEKIIGIKDLTYHYQDTRALNDVSLDIYKNEWLSIVGHNGSGKSTLSKLIVGLLDLQYGSITVNDIELSEETLYDVRSNIGIVFQNPDNQFVGTTVKDDIAFGLENTGVERLKMISLVDEFSEKVGMFEFLKREPHNLSGGQKQRVAIAGVLAMSPKIIILDEATSMLDPIGKKEIIELIKNLYNQKEITIISITHDLEEAANSDRIVVLNKGEIEMIGEPRDVLMNEQYLSDIGLDVPLSVKLSNKLNAAGIEVETAVTKEELIEKLCQLNLKK